MIHKKASARPSIYKVLETLCKIESEPHNELYSKAMKMLRKVIYLEDAQSAVAQLKKLIVDKERNN